MITLLTLVALVVVILGLAAVNYKTQQRYADLYHAAYSVLADHDERMRMYPEFQRQPNRVRVMNGLREELVKGA